MVTRILSSHRQGSCFCGKNRKEKVITTKWTGLNELREKYVAKIAELDARVKVLNDQEGVTEIIPIVHDNDEGSAAAEKSE